MNLRIQKLLDQLAAPIEGDYAQNIVQDFTQLIRDAKRMLETQDQDEAQQLDTALRMRIVALSKLLKQAPASSGTKEDVQEDDQNQKLDPSSFQMPSLQSEAPGMVAMFSSGRPTAQSPGTTTGLSSPKRHHHKLSKMDKELEKAQKLAQMQAYVIYQQQLVQQQMVQAMTPIRTDNSSNVTTSNSSSPTPATTNLNMPSPFQPAQATWSPFGPPSVQANPNPYNYMPTNIPSEVNHANNNNNNNNGYIGNAGGMGLFDGGMGLYGMSQPQPGTFPQQQTQQDMRSRMMGMMGNVPMVPY